MAGFASGVVVFSGLALLASEIPRPWLLKALGRPAITHLSIGVGAYGIHAGSIEGLVCAATAEVLSAMSIKFLRKAIGYIPPGKPYVAGWMRDYTSQLGIWDPDAKTYLNAPEEIAPCAA